MLDAVRSRTQEFRPVQIGVTVVMAWPKTEVLIRTFSFYLMEYADHGNPLVFPRCFPNSMADNGLIGILLILIGVLISASL